MSKNNNKKVTPVVKTVERKLIAKSDFYSIKKFGQYDYRLFKLENGNEVQVGPGNVLSVILGAFEHEISCSLIGNL